jgi:hypothetical protein
VQIVLKCRRPNRKSTASNRSNSCCSEGSSGKIEIVTAGIRSNSAENAEIWDDRDGRAVELNWRANEQRCTLDRMDFPAQGMIAAAH